MGSVMFLVACGKCEVISEFDQTNVVHTFDKGSYFGETALVKACKRTATVRAGTYTDLSVLSKKSLEKAVNQYPRRCRICSFQPPQSN